MVITQAGLELLSWAILDHDEKWLAPRERITAAGRLRLLLRRAGIPTEVPTALGALTTAIPRLKKRDKRRLWDGPDVFVHFRNRVIHPREPGPSRDELRNTWALGQQWLELLLLHAVGYVGDCVDRIASDSDGDEIVRSVPWAAPA